MGSHCLNVINSDKTRVLVCPPDFQPIVVPRKWIEVVVEPETEPRPPLIMLILNPDIVDTSSMELSAMETAHTTSFDSIRLRFTKMS